MKQESRVAALPPSRGELIACWFRCLLYFIGIAALSYVAITILGAELFQRYAMYSINTQTPMIHERPTGQLTPTIHEGDILGRIDIPRLRISIAVLQGTSSNVLRLGVGHIEGTPLPGDLGNSGIAGHRDTFFRKLQDIRKNDEIQLQTTTNNLHYEVDWVKVVAPDDTTVLKTSTTESELTLVTCYPFHYLGPAPKRFIVHARLQRVQ